MFYNSLGPLETLPREMVSRRKILSRSRDDLNLEHQYQQQEDEEDVWYQKDKLYKVSDVLLYCVTTILHPKCASAFVCANHICRANSKQVITKQIKAVRFYV